MNQTCRHHSASALGPSFLTPSQLLKKNQLLFAYYLQRKYKWNEIPQMRQVNLLSGLGESWREIQEGYLNPETLAETKSNLNKRVWCHMCEVELLSKMETKSEREPLRLRFRSLETNICMSKRIFRGFFLYTARLSRDFRIPKNRVFEAAKCRSLKSA